MRAKIEIDFLFEILQELDQEQDLEVETNYASFDFHIRVLFFRFGNSLLYYIKLGTSV